MKKLLLTFVAIGMMALPATAMAQENDEQPSYTTEEVNAGALGDAVILNSISDGKHGDERRFVDAAYIDEVGNLSDVWQGDTVNVKDGECYFVRIYVHNDNPDPSVVSENTRVAITLPKESGKTHEVSATITSDNAVPGEICDGVTFVSDHSFHLNYVYGSAYVVNQWAEESGEDLDLDEEVINGEAVLFGHDALDGRIPGGDKYEQYVCVSVYVVYDYSSGAETKVRLKGTDKWHDEIDAKVGDEVEYQIHFTNVDSEMLKDVVLYAAPDAKSLELVPGTIQYYTTADPEPKDVAQVDELFDYRQGVTFNDCASGSEIFLIYTAKVTDRDLEAGENTLMNWSQVSVVDSPRSSSHAAVRVRRLSKPGCIVRAICYAGIVICVAGIIRLSYKMRKAKKG